MCYVQPIEPALMDCVGLVHTVSLVLVPADNHHLTLVIEHLHLELLVQLSLCVWFVLTFGDFRWVVWYPIFLETVSHCRGCD